MSNETGSERNAPDEGLKNAVSMVLEQGFLTERESKLLDMRFGITDGCAHTLEEIGEHFGVTSERIRQIEAKGLRKIRFLLSKNIEQCPLTPCERSVLEMLFGRADGHWHTLKETADNLGLTCERTSQIESTAFLKICQSEKQRIEVQSKCEEPVTHDPDEILAQCIADNGVALGTPAQFSMCAVGISEDADMTLITRGNHLFVTLRIDRGNEDTRATLDFFHFNSKDIFELISLSAKGYTMIAQIDKQNSRKGDLRITPLKVFCDNPGTEVLLCTRLLELFTPIAEMALSVLNQVLNSKCNGMSVKDFGYSNFE